DGLRAQRGVRAQRDGDTRVDPGELLDGEYVGERVAAAAAVVLGEGNAHEVELAEPAHDVVGEGLRAVELLGDRCDLATREVANGALDQAVLVGQVEVHARDSHRG